MNRFFSLEEYRREVPRRVYALLSQQEGEILLMEAVDADWFDRDIDPDSGPEEWRRQAPTAPISILELKAIPTGIEPPPQTFEREGDEPDPGPWVELGLDANGGDGLIYLGLFAEPVPVGLTPARPLALARSATLDRILDLNPYVASERDIEFSLALLHRGIDWIGVYDVGQGSANGLCDAQGAPIAYFDLGGGVLANKATFPSSFSNICTTFDPPVILSHWDWDHWSSGSRFASATSLTWLAPNQKIGVVHSAFATSVAASGKLLIWPASLASKTIGQVTIEKCLGSSGRNNTGLALLVAGPQGQDHILLTGDARYTAIPSGLLDAHGVIVPHHGADMHSHSTPQSVGHAASRAAYSYGHGNSFSHPRSVTYSDHHAGAWQHRHILATGAIDRHTPDLRPALGHIALGWSSTNPIPLQPCGGRCSLQLTQR